MAGVATAAGVVAGAPTKGANATGLLLELGVAGRVAAAIEFGTCLQD